MRFQPLLIIFISTQVWAEPQLQPHTLTDAQLKAVLSMGQQPLENQIKVAREKFHLELVASHRKTAQKFFETLGPAKRSLETITDIEGLYGKAVCAKDGKKAEILIADDAPPSTLLHEYIHGLQMETNPRWCALEGRVLENEEKHERALLYHSFEFEVLKTLWDLREKFNYNVEDNLILIEGLNRENQVFISQNVKGLDDETAKLVEREFEEAKVRLDFFTWLTKTPAEATGVLQKLEVIALKSCVEKTSGKTDTVKINRCLQKRCEYSHMNCQAVSDAELSKFGDDLLSKIIFAWTKPLDIENCEIPRLRDEFVNGLEQATQCWTKWVESRGLHKKSLTLVPAREKEVERRFRVPPLNIDSKTEFLEAQNPEALINKTYCYFVFQSVIKFESLPVDQFPYSMMGASLSSAVLPEYKDWLVEDSKGKLCAKIVKLFTGAEPEILTPAKKTKYILVFNPIAALTGGIEQLQDNLGIDINHERLHSVFADSAEVRKKVKAEWQALSADEKESFKKRHSSYDFSQEEVLLREYFSYTRQNKPQKLF